MTGSMKDNDTWPAIFGNVSSSTVLIQPVFDSDPAEMEKEAAHIRELAGDDFCLMAVKVRNWNDDLSPWKAQAVFGKDGFGGGAGTTLEKILTLASDPGKKYILGGYSLAGLFSLWAACRTGVFSGIAAASPSVWFPGIIQYLEDNDILVPKVYLSLGDREEKTRNPLMSTVGDNIRKIGQILSDRGIKCTLEWNEGNHFRDADIRTAKAFAWVVDQRTVP